MIDQKIIDAYQWIVDESEKQPAWWAEQVAWVSAVTSLVSTAIQLQAGDANLLLSLLSLTGSAFFIIGSRVPSLLAFLGSIGRFLRFVEWFYLVVRVILIMTTPTPIVALRLVTSFFTLSFFYFAACQPPRPRKRRHAAVKGMA